ncbi:MAG: hypothetical protein DME34_04595 [Verrucomicrobia bacterium]|nr:MAG: hypothetical protein DME34_04595 [Verrucomicrobiota bacterium]
MKLFRKSRAAAQPAQMIDVSPLPGTVAPIQAPRAICLSAEQKCLLEKPVDPRVDRIMQEIYADRAAAEAALKARRIIAFPSGDSGERHVIQGADGLWRIVPGPAPTTLSEFFDSR